MPNVLTYNALISACVTGGQVRKARELFRAMKPQGVLPDVMTYTLLISACEKVKQPLRALKILETMKQQGVMPDVRTYNSLMQVLAASGHIIAGLWLLAEVEPLVLLS